MKILILSASHPLKAAGIVAYDLLKGLSSINENEVRILVRDWDKYDDRRIIPIETTLRHYWNVIFRLYKKIKREILRTMFRGKKINSNFEKDYIFEHQISKTFYSTNVILKRAGFKPDVILVLFMPAFISFKNLYELNKLTGAPVFLYPLDMAPFTGGCHYAWDCLNYQTICGKCPALFSNQVNDLANSNFTYKKRYIEQMDVELIAATEELFKQISKSSLFQKSKLHKGLIPIDCELFQPADKFKIRHEIGIPVNKKIIFTGAVLLKERRKGLNELIEALNYLYNNIENEYKNNIHIIIAGTQHENMEKTIPFPYSFMGYLTIKELSRLFQASDIFVSPSIEDSGPMMINQSIMCGTPVVAFEIGVALDLVITGKTGYRAKHKDSTDLAKGINFLLKMNEKEYNIMSNNCRELGLKLCHPQIQSKKFIELFEELMDTKQ